MHMSEGRCSLRSKPLQVTALRCNVANTADSPNHVASTPSAKPLKPSTSHPAAATHDATSAEVMAQTAPVAQDDDWASYRPSSDTGGQAAYARRATLFRSFTPAEPDVPKPVSKSRRLSRVGRLEVRPSQNQLVGEAGYPGEKESKPSQHDTEAEKTSQSETINQARRTGQAGCKARSNASFDKVEEGKELDTPQVRHTRPECIVSMLILAF